MADFGGRGADGGRALAFNQLGVESAFFGNIALDLLLLGRPCLSLL